MLPTRQMIKEVILMAITKISANGLNLIKKFEGCRLTAYQDSVGVWTIGYGTTNADKAITHLEIKKGVKITQKQADNFLNDSVNKKYSPKVSKYNSKYNWTQNQFDALVSFAYNIGSIDQLVANGTRSIAEISNKILAYDKAGGKSLSGLTRRRKAEKELFDKDSKSAKVSDNKVNNSEYSQKEFWEDAKKALSASSIKSAYTLAPTISMVKNNKHKLVTPMQKYMKALGYYNGSVDGVFGSKMALAIKEYQRNVVKAKSADIDGICTHLGATYKKLFGV